MNDIEKAIEIVKYIKNMRTIKNTELEIKAFDLAISALEKQMSKKVQYNEHSQAVCPDEDCKDTVLKFYNYCPLCGQKLDWSEVENE